MVALDAEDLFRINGKILACDGVDRTDTALAMGELIPFRIQPLLERPRTLAAPTPAAPAEAALPHLPQRT